MQKNLINMLFQEKKFELFYKELAASIQKIESEEIIFELLVLFEKANLEYKNPIANLDYVCWKLAIGCGRLKLSSQCAESYLENLIVKKRTVKALSFINELEKNNSNVRKINSYKHKIQLLNGETSSSTEELYESLNLDWHNFSNEELKQKIINCKGSEIIKTKLIYEFVLKFQFDEEIFLIINTLIKDNSRFNEFKNFMSKKGIDLVRDEPKIKKESTVVFNTNYDDLALKIIENNQQATKQEELKVIASLRLKDPIELINQGEDMLMAFRLLEMNSVVYFLAEELLKQELTTNKIASIEYIKVQTMIDEGLYFDAKNEINRIFLTIPLSSEEHLVFSKALKEIAQKMRKNEAGKIKS